jgi:hypothetical protein
MDVLVTLGRTLAFSFAGGVNLYATVVIIGLAHRIGWVDLPSQFAAFDNGWVIGVAGLLFAVEFVVDKVRWLDTVWDGIHTAVRPLGGALVALAALGEAAPITQGAVALLGALVAGSSHFAKAGTRAMVNASPEPFSNWFISLVEDVLVVALAAVALLHPVAAFAICLGLLGAIALSATVIVRAMKRRFLRPPEPPP